MTVLIRSKNAGPFVLTFDVMFTNQEMYNAALSSGVVNGERIASLYGVPVDKVLIFECPECVTIKITIPRYMSSGDPNDGDVYGAQQHGPLINLEIPTRPNEWGS